MTTTITTPNADTVTEQAQSSSYSFLQAILHKDVLTLRKFGVDDKTANAIDLKTQIDVAQKLLASDNNQRRSMSKRLMAAQAGLTTKTNSQEVTTSSNVTTATPSSPQKPVFFTSVAAGQDHLAAQLKAAPKAVA